MSDIIKVLADNPVWFINDMVVVILFIATIIFIVKKEEHPTALLLEAVTFIFLYSLIFDNFSISFWDLWVYGRSIFMFGGTILSMPLTEWMITYTGLRLLGKAKGVPVWMQIIILGLLGLLLDLSLDPVAIRQVTNGLGRWTWHMRPDWPQYLGIPMYNFFGWIAMPVCIGIPFLIGRNLYKKSGYKSVIGYAYPFLGAIGGLVIMASIVLLGFFVYFLLSYPASIYTHLVVEWYVVGLWMLIGFVGILMWRFRMKSPLELRGDWPIIVIPTVLHLADIVGALALGITAVTINAIVFTIIHLAILFSAFIVSRKSVISSENRQVTGAI